MSEWRRAVSTGKRDIAEPEVMEEFEAGGARCTQHSGKNEGDLFVAYRGRWHAVEVKTGSRQRTRRQRDWADAQPAPVYEARNRAQANKLLRMWDLEFAEAQSHGPSLEDDLGKEPEHGE